jgi:asparagine synthase (glutamine-hydrolysing)
MCGICGVLQLGPQPEPVDEALVTRMTAVVAHRGPDDSGTYVNGRVGLGLRRLAVIDLSRNGHQPMCNEDGSVWIVFNGEIYNFAELKKEYQLEARGHVFRSATDTEVLVHLYEEFGPDLVTKLNGMYAYAIWDARRQELHLARDPFGVKPLFYARQGTRFLFGSEIKSILQDPRVPRRPNLQALHDFLTFAYVPGEQTAFAGIWEVPPGHRMVIDRDGKVTTTRFFDLAFNEDESLDERQAVHQARDLLHVAVKRQLVADVPVGVLLSGGMDSSTIVALMHRHTSEPIHTYSVGFEDQSFNELPHASLVAKMFATQHHEVVVTPAMVRDVLPKYIGYIDEPYADGSAIPTYFVCELARREVVVVLSGEGGDEAFAGYDTHAAYKTAQWFRHIPRFVRQCLLAPLVNCLPVSHKKLSLEFKLKRFLGGLDLPPPQAHLWWRIVLTESQKRALYTPAVLEELSPAAPDRHFAEVFGRSGAKDVLNRLLLIDASVFLPDDLMIKNDRMSMAHSLEARVPMTDPELTGFMARVPARLKLPRLRKKHLMRRAMEGVLPRAILNKKKVGLEMPYSRWLKHELNDVLMSRCAPSRLAETGLFRPDAVEQLIGEHMAGQRDHGRALWGLLNYMLWHERYIA